jgi:hypothetical protein
VLSLSDCGTIVHERKLVLELTQHSMATCHKRGSNNDVGTINRADYGTIVHTRKLVLELTQRGFPTNHPPWWLALYGYLQLVGLSFFARYEILFWLLRAHKNLVLCSRLPNSTRVQNTLVDNIYFLPRVELFTIGRTPRRCPPK